MTTFFSMRGRRAVTVLATAVLGLGLLAACGNSDDDNDASGSAISVEGKFGETKVPRDAKRVVTVGYNDQDFTLALGVVPVASRAFFDSYDNLPWVQQATGGKGVPKMAGDSINLEEIAKAKPDVIFAIYETIDQKTYDQLSQIAPTVIQSGDYEDEQTPWDVQMLTTGKALGRDAQARELVDKVKSKIDAAKAENPEFANKTLVVDYGPENGGHYLIGKNDPRRALFDALGFNAQDTVGDVSDEKLNLLDRDVLFIEGATKAQMAASPAFSRLNAVREDRTLYTTFESPLAGALSYSGPNALLYAIDVVVPQLSNALTGKPVADLTNA